MSQKLITHFRFVSNDNLNRGEFVLNDGSNPRLTCNYIRTTAGCEAAARELGLSDTSVSDDYQNGAEYDPPFCYFEEGRLMFNIRETNTGPCTTTDICLCHIGEGGRLTTSQSGSLTSGRRGFQIEYNALDTITECGGNFTNSSGILTSPSYPNQYQGMEECVYLITTPIGTLVNISFLTMDINCNGTPSDYIEMRNGISEDSPLMGRLCGDSSQVPLFLQTRKNNLRIK